jgi:hypothetical protein
MTMKLRPDRELASAALIGATDTEARAIVERLLSAEGIDCFIEGSVVYSIQVPSVDVARAREILESSSELEGHWIQFPAG